MNSIKTYFNAESEGGGQRGHQHEPTTDSVDMAEFRSGMPSPSLAGQRTNWASHQPGNNAPYGAHSNASFVNGLGPVPTPADSTLNVGGTTTPGSFRGGGRRGSDASAAGSRAGSRPGTPRTGKASARSSMMDITMEMAVQAWHGEQLRRRYNSGMMDWEGVVMKASRDNFVCYPPHLKQMPGGLYDAVKQMNVRCAMTVNTRVVWAVLDKFDDRIEYLPLPSNLRVQVLGSMRELPRAKLHHFGAFIQDIQALVVWDDKPEDAMRRADELEAGLMAIIWRGGAEEEDEEGGQTEKAAPTGGLSEEEVEEAMKRDARPIRLGSSVVVAFTLILTCVSLGLGVRWLALEITVDGSYLRLALLAALPLQVIASLFFFQSICGCLCQLFGPVSAVYSNSRYYSGRPPTRIDYEVLPHITIQMPVYKEGLNSVIKLTVQSLKQAISTYEMQGGTANIFVNDDGMQLISEEEAFARQEFYSENRIGWVARPGHNPDGSKPGPKFERRGKFKKASNMNYALHISNRVEEKMARIVRGDTWSAEKEDEAYERALSEVVAEDEGRTMAEGNIRMGDYILIIDSDTRVPKDCLLDAVSEMELSPEVAIIQFSSGVMRVTNSFFEKGVEWFTNLIYSSITFAVSIGDVACFVGHNAILRWSALQQIPYVDDHGYEKYWGEQTVSEDFEMALRLQTFGYHIRFASYTGAGFQEGVSLTVYDELNRWEKYAYGCNELVFHPFKDWLFKGPFTPLFRKFIFSNMHFPKKLTILAYIGTYYAIAASWLLTLANFFLVGWFNGLYDKYYLDSFAVFISVVVVFTGLSNVSLAILRYRLKQQGILDALWSNFIWTPMFVIFLGGLSLHLSQAILSHFFSIDMQWGATSKEVDDILFGKEAWRILKRFKWTFLFCATCLALLICAFYGFPYNWRIDAFPAVFPLALMAFCHFALPLTLNPVIMTFTW